MLSTSRHEILPSTFGLPSNIARLLWMLVILISAWLRCFHSSAALHKQVCLAQSASNSIRVKIKITKMKLSTICLVGFASATEKKVPPRHPLQRLNRLVEFTSEILNSGAFNNKSVRWIENWELKFARNAARMEQNFSRGNQRCGFYDENLPHGGPSDDRKKRDVEFDRYDRVNPCRGTKQLITGFTKWSERYISSCSGQKNHKHQATRMEKWAGIMNKGKRVEVESYLWLIQYDKIFDQCYQFKPVTALQCDSYTFVLPSNWYQLASEKMFEVGHSFQVSALCNPNYIIYDSYLSQNFNCDDIKSHNGCNFPVGGLFYSSKWNTNGHLETFLQCPQCGCGSEGAANLNDLYAAELEGSRTVWVDANSMFNFTINT